MWVENLSHLLNVAQTHWRSGNTTEALKYYEQAAALCRRCGDIVRLQTILSRIGTAYMLLGNDHAALKAWHDELKLARREHNPMRLIHALSMVSQGYRNLGNQAEQRRYYDEMMRIYRALPHRVPVRSEMPGLFDPLQEMWQIALDVGARASDHQEMDVQLECWEQYRRRCEAQGNVEGVVEALNRIAQAYQLAGQTEEALQRYEEIMTICEAQGNVEGVVEAHTKIAEAYQLAGQIGKALQRYEEIIRLGEARGDSVIQSNALMGMANVWHGVADDQRMLDCCERAYSAITREIERRRTESVLPSRYDVALQLHAASILSPMGYAHEIIGKQKEMEGNDAEKHQRYGRALECHFQALAIVQRELGEKVSAALGIRDEQTTRSLRQLLPDILNGIGGVYYARGDYENALNYYQQAVEGFKNTQQHKARGWVVSFNIALTHLDKGDSVKAEELFSKIISEYGEQRSLEDQPAYFANRGRARLRQGKLAEAKEDLEKALKSAESHRERIQGRSEARMSYFVGWAPIYADMVRLRLKLADNASSAEQAESLRWEAWHWVHRSRSRTFLELLANARPRLTSEEDRKLWEELKQLERELIHWRWEFERDGDSSRERESRVQLERVEQDYEQKREEVVRRIEGAQALMAVDVPPPQEVVKSLRKLAGTNGHPSDYKPLLVEFFTQSDEEIAVFLLPLWKETPDEKESPPVVVPIRLESGSVRRMTKSLLDAVDKLKSQSRSGAAQEAPPNERRAAHEQFEQLLHDMGPLIQPWMQYVMEKKWQPSELVLSPHFLLNLLPLHAAMWKGKLLIEHYPVIYLPSPALAEEIAKRHKLPTGEDKSLARGGLLLGNPTGDLPGRKQEVNCVAKHLATREIQSNTFVIEQATTDRVYAHAPEAGLFHYAGHSVLDSVDFLRSGMELADRRLTVLDIMATLELKQAVLTYLGSCDSARAVPGPTDELMALVRSFFYAGTPTVIASLWALHDGAGSTFADHFYKFWMRKGKPMAMAEAFQKAMLETRTLYPQPFDWAPFVLMGAWQTNERRLIMSILKLFGFTPEEMQLLQSKVKAERWEAGQLEKLRSQRPADEVWVVCVTAAEEFLQEVFRLVPPGQLPKAVLWVPQGKEPLSLDDWWEGFHAQLREESAADRAFLEKISRCARVLDWGERVEDIPAKWFARLTESPHPGREDHLPFNEEERRHLRACADCREEAYERLQGRAEMRWEMLCPSVDEIAEWLETEKSDPRLEEHVKGCGLCRETVKRQAWLWEGAGLLKPKEVDAKLAAVVARAKAGLEAALDWPQAPAEAAVAWAARLAAMLCLHTVLHPAWRTAGAPAEETGVSLEDLNAYLAAGDPMALLGEEQWLWLMADGDDAVLLRAGRSPADRFEQFRVEFRRGEEVVVSVLAADGVARLTPEHFQTAQRGQADRLVIFVV